MRPGRGQQPLVADDLVAAQADLMDGMRIVEPVMLALIGLAEVLPTLLVDEDGMAKPENPIHQLGMQADLGTVDDLEHGDLLDMLSRRK